MKRNVVVDHLFRLENEIVEDNSKEIVETFPNE